MGLGIKVGLPVVAVAGFFAVQRAMAEGKPPPSWADGLAVLVILGLLAASHRSRPAADAEHHESLSQPFSFRLGQALNRVRRSFRR